MAFVKTIKSIKGKVSLNYNELSGLEGIINELTDKYPIIKKVILYGSRARGDFVEDSDMDLLFVLDNGFLRTIKSQMSDIIYNHELSNDIVVSAVFVSEADFKNKLSTFLLKVRREGITLWSKE